MDWWGSIFFNISGSRPALQLLSGKVESAFNVQLPVFRRRAGVNKQGLAFLMQGLGLLEIEGANPFQTAGGFLSLHLLEVGK